MLTILFFMDSGIDPAGITTLNQETLPNRISACLFAGDARGRNSNTLTSPINSSGVNGGNLSKRKTVARFCRGTCS